MLDVIDLFNEQDTRDEIGIGAIRDAFADRLFPGTSTIQTRARYFLIVPWIYQRVEEWVQRKRGRVAAAEVERYARNLEIRLIEPLLAGEDIDGVIGQEAGASLKRLPSSVYWQGLGFWGVRLVSLSLQGYHQTLARFGPPAVQPDEDLDSTNPSRQFNWHPGLPKEPDGFPEVCSLLMRPEDSFYLQDRIRQYHPETLLAFLVNRGQSFGAVTFSWELQDAIRFPSSIQSTLEHARNFSEAIHGAQLLYNLMLARLEERSDLIEKYRRKMHEWQDMLLSRPELAQWDLQAFWHEVEARGQGVHPLTRKFIDSWLEMVLGHARPADLADNRRAWDLIRNRERFLKKANARLENKQARERWSGAAGTARLDFRWKTAKSHLLDIITGLEPA